MVRGLGWKICAALAAVTAAWFVGIPSAAADPPAPVRGDLPPNGLCLICHSHPGLTAKVGEEQERPIDAVEPRAFEASAHRDVRCAACHPAQSPLPHRRLGPEGYGDASDAIVCARCHTDAYESYLDSAHGTMVNLSDARAPTCDDCHGSAHAVKSVQEWTADERAQACAECHSGAGPSFLEALGHEPPSPGYRPATYFAGRFLVILTAAVLAFGIIHVELEMLRWLVRRRRTRSVRKGYGDPPETP